MKQLIEKVETLQAAFQSMKDNRMQGCAISPNTELEVLQKVRTYINLNESYHNVIIKQEFAPDDKPEESIVDVLHDKAKKSEKISYVKAMKL